jgi:cyclic beta-1,2-glucan synthetase
MCRGTPCLRPPKPPLDPGGLAAPSVAPSRGTPRGRRARPNPLSPLSRWKILDNLRRSLHAPALLRSSSPAGGSSPNPVPWTLLLLGVAWGSPFCSTWWARSGARSGTSRRSRTSWSRRARWAGRFGRMLPCSCLPPLRGLDRGRCHRAHPAPPLVSRTRLLEWDAAAVAAPSRAGGPGVLLRRMWQGPGAGGGVPRPRRTGGPRGRCLPGVLAFLWFASPAVWRGSPSARSSPAVQDAGTFPEIEARRDWHGASGGTTSTSRGRRATGSRRTITRRIPGRDRVPHVAHEPGMGLVATVTAWDLGFLDTSRWWPGCGSWPTAWRDFRGTAATS